MPYAMREVEGEGWCVFVIGESDPVKCHPTRPKALAHLRALGANVEEAEMVPGGVGNLETGFFVDLFADGKATASRVLNGEPICILPVGQFWRGGQMRDITDAVVAQFVENWEERENRGIRRRRLAVDFDHDRRARGWYEDVMALAEGLGATFSWTEQGRRALEAGEYAYFSPTVYWRLQDRVTNEVVENQLGGGALTNYPFFGESTALFSLRDLSEQAPPIYYAVTKTEGGVEYPARAYLVVEDSAKPTTWHLRVYSWKSGELVLDHKLMGAAHAALTDPTGGHRGNPYEGPQKQEATRKLRRLYEREGLDFTQEGGFTMSDNEQAGGEVNAVREFFAQLRALIPTGQTGAGETGTGEVEALQTQIEEMSQRMEELAGLQTTVETLQTERDEFASRVEDLQGRLSVEEGMRRIAEFASRVAQEFAHIPGEAADLAAHLSWLHAVDAEEGQPHAEFFMALLRSADAQFADAFSERGDGSFSGGGVMDQINALARKYMADHDGVEFMDAISAVLAENPQLYEAYTNDVAGGVQ